MNKNFTNQHKKLYDSLYNNLVINKTYIEINKTDYILVKQRYLMSYIENNKNWSMSTKKCYLFMCARWLLLHNSEKYSKRYSQAGFNIKQDIEKIENNNEMDITEKESMKDYSYFVSILDNIDYKLISNYEEHQRYLLLSMLILQPPLRTSFYTSCKIIRSKRYNDKINNYLLLSKRGKNSGRYIINKDKATNYKTFNMDKNLSKIIIEDNDLIKLLHFSYEQYPRVYLFERNSIKMSDQQLLSMLRKITNIPKINVNMMRSINVTKHYKTNINYNSKIELANKMRHSAETAAIHYNEINESDFNNNNDELIIQLQNEIYELKQKTTELESKNVDFTDSKLYNKRKSDILYLIKSGKSVKKSTLEKYNIK